MKIGLISDTHGLLRPAALEALRGCQQLVHAGDIGKPEILDALRALAPLTVVRGNNDPAPRWPGVAAEQSVRCGEIGLYVTHETADIPRPLPPGTDVVVTGHSHKPLEQWRDGVLFVNPGSAGPRRFKLPISVALLHVQGREIRVEFVPLA
jgi:putative phosphoesterase